MSPAGTTPSVGSCAPVPAPRMKRRKHSEHKQSTSALSESTVSLTDDAKEKTTLAVFTETVEKTTSAKEDVIDALEKTISVTAIDASFMERTCSDVSINREEREDERERDSEERQLEKERQSEGEAGVLRMFCSFRMLGVDLRC